MPWDADRHREQLRFLYILGCYSRREGGIQMEITAWKDRKGRGRTRQITMWVDDDVFRRLDAEIRKAKGWG